MYLSTIICGVFGQARGIDWRLTSNFVYFAGQIG